VNVEVARIKAATCAYDGVEAFALRRGAEEFPEIVRRQAALLLLDTLGVDIAAAPMEAGRIARNVAAPESRFADLSVLLYDPPVEQA